MTEDIDFTLSKLHLHSSDYQNEDWDRSLILADSDSLSASGSRTSTQPLTTNTPRNSVVYFVDDDATPTRVGTQENTNSVNTKVKRSLGELLRLHAEKGTDCRFSQEEASRVADVLGQWINASSSPYEGEDDFFLRSQDDLSIPPKKQPVTPTEGRPRGQSESANSRPPSSTGFIRA